ncbi:MAG: 8-oxo-dGTP diphosphatase [Patescibacteria group bacterium]|nr:NUDIX domain-containing protein [Candidatus Saccharibacteria bacterium]MDQ5962931.1 8-oxo-dGTP diphosphatase [Patescibacteria group bacterium]
MTVYDTARPYAAAYVLLERDGKVACVKRVNTGWMDGYYGLPSGKVEKGEGFLAAAVREVKEEVGVNVAPQDLEFVSAFWRCEADDSEMEWVDILFRANTWEGEPYNAEPHVHSEIAWLDLSNLPDTVIPSLKKMLESAQEHLGYGEIR